jgi:hypothetical protein
MNTYIYQYFVFLVSAMRSKMRRLLADIANLHSAAENETDSYLLRQQ